MRRCRSLSSLSQPTAHRNHVAQNSDIGARNGVDRSVAPRVGGVLG